MKSEYENLDIEIIGFAKRDVILTSDPTEETKNEGPID